MDDAISSTAAGKDGADLEPRECVAIAIRSAFALPRTGAFSDLLSAIDTAARANPVGRNPSVPVSK